MKRTNQALYFVGIGGVGMTSVAGLAHAAGFDVRGSDQNLYPPTSHILKDLKIPVLIPYSEDNILNNLDCLFIIGNSLSRQHIEVAKILDSGAQYTSFPKLLEDFFLGETDNIVVCGTHGKTTTSSLLSYVLDKLGSDPSYMIGGAPLDLPHAFHKGSGTCFVLEGDEYDTAFFDKGSKFLHYKPRFIVLNNLEFDHADIFKDFAAVKRTFHLLLDQIADPENIIANLQDAGVRELLNERGWLSKVSASFDFSEPIYDAKERVWKGQFQTPLWRNLSLETLLAGSYNFSNVAQVLTILTRLVDCAKLPLPSAQQIQEILRSFRGVERRWQHLASIDGMELYVDFAHHPTAVRNVLTNLRKIYKTERIIAAFEPKNASSRRNVFQKEYAEVLKQADQVLIAPSHPDQRIPEAERFNPETLCASIGTHASSFLTFDTLNEWLMKELKRGDVLVFLSCGDFSGLPRNLVGYLQKEQGQIDIR